MDIHAQAWALREQGMRLGDIAKELRIELRDVAQLLSDKGTQPKRRSEPGAPVAPRTKQHDGAPASTSSAEAQRLKTIADLLACKPAEIEQALDTLTGALADESALREHLQSQLARVDAITKLLGCDEDNVAQAISDLMDALTEEIERREAAEATIAHVKRGRLEAVEELLKARREIRLEREQLTGAEAGWSEWMLTRDAARRLGVVPASITRYSQRGTMGDGRRFERRPALPSEGDAHTKFMVRYELTRQQ